MPQKINRAGQMQNYVPAGNGDASGEYGDHATGSNKHFKVFKKPADETPISTQQPTTAETKENEQTDNKETQKQDREQIKNQIAENEKRLKDIVDKAEVKTQYVRYNNGELTIYNDRGSYYLDMPSNYVKIWNEFRELGNFKIMNEEQQKEFTDAYIKDIELNLDLFTNNSEFRKSSPLRSIGAEEHTLESYIPDLEAGNIRLMKTLGFSENEINGVRGAWYKKTMRTMYPEMLKEIEEKTLSIIDEKRTEIGKEYIEQNFKKVNEGYNIEEALKLCNPKFTPRTKDPNEPPDANYYRINCQRCPFTYELLRRGYEVQAQGNDDEYGRDGRWEAQMCWKEKHDIKAKSYVSLKKQTDEIISKAGNGARFVLGVNWKDYGGHAFIGENVNGKVVYMDSQMNKYDVGEEYFKKIQANNSIFLGRMDNAEFSGAVRKTALSSKGE